jgi:DNA adenine methylase
MSTTTADRPFLRWNGGKTYRLGDISRILAGFPTRDYHYIEPMVGGGAVYFALSPSFKKAAIGDVQPDLSNLYRVVADRVDDLLATLNNGEYWYEGHDDQASKDNYRRIRALEPSDPIDRAARWYYLNRTCINGLMRTNKAGKMNAAPGDVKTFRPDGALLRRCSEAMRDTAIFRGEAQTILGEILNEYRHKKLFLFVDPPYHDERQGKYVGYAGGFSAEDQACLVESLLSTGQPFIYTNKATDLIKGLFPPWVCTEIHPLRHKVGPRECRGKEEMELVAYWLGT